MLAEEYPLKTVIRGIPVGVEKNIVKGELQDQGFKIESVVKMRRKKPTRTR